MAAIFFSTAASLSFMAGWLNFSDAYSQSGFRLLALLTWILIIPEWRCDPYPKLTLYSSALNSIYRVVHVYRTLRMKKIGFKSIKNVMRLRNAVLSSNPKSFGIFVYL